MGILATYANRVSTEDHNDPNVEVEVEVKIELPEVQEVSEDDEYEADEIVQDDMVDEREYEKGQIEDDRVMDEIGHHSVAMESLVDTLQFGLENGKYDPQFAAVVSDTIARAGEALGDEVPTVTLENYGVDQLNEFYTVSIEDIAGKLDKMAEIQEKVILRALVGPFSAAVKLKRNAVAESLIKKGDALIARISELDSVIADVSLKGMEKKLASKGTVSTPVLGTVRKDQASTAELLQKFGPAALDYCSTLFGQLEDVVKKMRSKEKGAVDATLKGLAALKLPENLISEGIRSGSAMIGNAYLKMNKTNQWAEVAERSPPRFATHKGASGPATMKVSKADLLAMANAVKAYGVMMKAANTDLTNKASKAKTDVSTQARNVRMNNQGGWWMSIINRNAQFQALWKLCRAYPFDTAAIINGSFSHCRTSATAVAALADRGIDAVKKASKG